MPVEFLNREQGNLRLDRLGVVLMTGEPPEANRRRTVASVTRVRRVLARDLTATLDEPVHLRPVPVPTGPCDRGLHLLILPVPATTVIEVVLGQHPLFDVLMEPVEVDIGQDGTGRSALR